MPHPYTPPCPENTSFVVFPPQPPWVPVGGGLCHHHNSHPLLSVDGVEVLDSVGRCNPLDVLVVSLKVGLA